MPSCVDATFLSSVLRDCKTARGEWDVWGGGGAFPHSPGGAATILILRPYDQTNT